MGDLQTAERYWEKAMSIETTNGAIVANLGVQRKDQADPLKSKSCWSNPLPFSNLMKHCWEEQFGICTSPGREI
jgi:hypothetical protein